VLLQSQVDQHLSLLQAEEAEHRESRLVIARARAVDPGGLLQGLTHHCAGRRDATRALRGAILMRPSAGRWCVDVETVDREYQQLEQESQQLTVAIQQLAGKLQAASGTGDLQAKEWLLDLKSIALQIQQEQLQVQTLLQALHQFAVTNIQPDQPGYASAQPGYVVASPPTQGASGLLSRFSGSGFGRAMSQGVGMGAGFGIADSVINAIFH
jgi:hypothetical protein